MTRFFSAIVLLMTSQVAMAQWQSINPGAGGQVQDIVCDPNTPGTLYLASDMEGVYKSIDNGESWAMTGQLADNRVYAVAVAQGNTNRVYVGTLYGLETSNDGGKNYQYVTETKRRSIGCVAANPHDPNQVIAGFGWRDDYDFLWVVQRKDTGKGKITVSDDGGKSWKIKVYDQDKKRDRNVWTINYDPVNKNVIYLSTGPGIFKSSDAGSSWHFIPGPANTVKHTGLSISPDGQVIYATYGVDGYSGNIYASPTSEIHWQKVMGGDGIQLKELNYWYPETDPRGKGGEQKLLVGLLGQRDGLFEGTFNWNSPNLESYSWKKIWQGTKGYDTGWDWADPNARVAHYTPASWPRAVWSTTNQTIFEGVPEADGFHWNNKYCKPNDKFTVHWAGMDFHTYSGRGTESTYTYDIAVDQNYVIQGQGDNGLMESWDGGYSWNNMQHRTDSINYSDVQAVAIGKANGVPVVIAQATGGYGGAALDGRILVKKLEHHSPEDHWELLGGGPDHALGLPNGIFRDVATAPSNPSRAYMFSSGHGMYMIDDLGKAMEARGKGLPYQAVKISNGIIDKVESSKKIAVDPTDENTVYFTGTSGAQGLYKGVNTDGNWQWTKIYDGHSWEAEVAAWEYQGKTYLVYEGASNEKGNCGCDFIVALSDDKGATWKNIFDVEKAKELRGDKNDSWYPYIKDKYVFQSKGGIAATGNTIVCNLYNHKFQHGFGVFKGTLKPNNEVEWQDWTDNLDFCGITSGLFAEQEGKTYYYISTPGAGAWRRELKPGK